MNYLLNAISRNRVIYRVANVAENAVLLVDFAALSDPIRFDDSLAELLEAWELVVAVDPYWHVPVADADKQRVAVAGPWCSESLVRLEKATGSAGGVLRAEQFLARAGADSVFNAFAGVPQTQAEFLAQFGIDDKKITTLLGHTAANIRSRA